MIADAERYREEDEKSRLRVSSRNSLESYLFSVRSAIKEFAVDLTKKIPESDLVHLEKVVNEDITWLETNREQEAVVYEEKLKNLQQLIVPIMGKIHKNDLNEDSDKNGPKIEEVLN